MSDDNPTITVTRGKRSERSKRKSTTSGARSRSSSGLGLPGPGRVISGMIRGVRTAWWAGLGVLSVARSAGAQVFDALVEEGKSWEQERRKKTEATARRVQHLTEESDAVRAVEERVREGVNDALQRVGVPPREEVDALREQIDALSDRIERLAQSVDEEEA